MGLKAFPRPVARFDDWFIFTTLTATEVQRAARDPYAHPKTGKACTLWTMDGDMQYLSFARDYGPFNISYVFEACLKIYDKLHPRGGLRHPVCLFTLPHPGRKASMALVAALYQILVEHRKPHEAFVPVAELELRPFRDAGNGAFEYGLSIQDCLYGVDKAICLGLLDIHNLQVDWYRHHEQVQNGDLNILGDFIPFASPIEASWVTGLEAAHKEQEAGGTPIWPPITKSHIASRAFHTVLEVFEEQNVGAVVRLNDELYDKRHFLDKGIDHYDMYFNDGSNPSDAIVRDFITLATEYIEKRGLKVAVHCKAGLGRTGVLIGAYLIYKYRFSAQEAIAYMRVVRPGMVVASQQRYMVENQMRWVQWAAVDEVMKTLRSQSASPKRMDVLRRSSPLPPSSSPLPDGRRARAALGDLTVRHQTSSPRGSPVTPSRDDDAILVLKSKGGDAVGQPRKMASRPTAKDSEVKIESPQPRSMLPRPTAHLDGTTGLARGIKRGAGSRRSPIPSSFSVSPERGSISLQTTLGVPSHRAQRSSSIISVSSSDFPDNDRPARKRQASGKIAQLGPKSSISASPSPRRDQTPPVTTRSPANTSNEVMSSVARLASRLRRKSPTTPSKEASRTTALPV